MIKAFKYRLYPNKTVEQKLQWVLDRCRELYNAALQERKEAYKYAKKSIGYVQQCACLTEIKATVRTEYQEINAHVLQNVLNRLDKAVQGFFRRIKNGEKPGYPRFQGKNRYDSFTYPDQWGWKLEGKHLVLSKIGKIKIKLHRKIVGKIKTCTVKREGDEWYAVFTCDAEPVQKLPYTDDAIGIDLGLLHFATLSTGDTIENSRYYRKSEKKLAKAQQKVASKKKGSHRYKKASKQVGKIHRKIARQRKDFLHKQSRQLVNTYEVIVFEDLQSNDLVIRPKSKKDEETGQYLPNGASAKSGLNKSITDAGWGYFVQYCTYKAAWAGITVLKVNPHKTSQICSGCGVIRKKELSERWHSCECGCELDRDHNAAINILRLGSSQLGNK